MDKSRDWESKVREYFPELRDKIDENQMGPTGLWIFLFDALTAAYKEKPMETFGGCEKLFRYHLSDDEYEKFKRGFLNKKRIYSVPIPYLIFRDSQIDILSGVLRPFQSQIDPNQRRLTKERHNTFRAS